MQVIWARGCLIWNWHVYWVVICGLTSRQVAEAHGKKRIASSVFTLTGKCQKFDLANPHVLIHNHVSLLDTKRLQHTTLLEEVGVSLCLLLLYADTASDFFLTKVPVTVQRISLLLRSGDAGNSLKPKHCGVSYIISSQYGLKTHPEAIQFVTVQVAHDCTHHCLNKHLRFVCKHAESACYIVLANFGG